MNHCVTQRRNPETRQWSEIIEASNFRIRTPDPISLTLGGHGNLAEEGQAVRSVCWQIEGTREACGWGGQAGWHCLPSLSLKCVGVGNRVQGPLYWEAVWWRPDPPRDRKPSPIRAAMGEEGISVAPRPLHPSRVGHD